MTSELTTLLSLQIPESASSPDGFLEIGGIAHHENVNSRIYAHFLNCQHKEIRSLFLNALLDVIATKTDKKIHFNNYYSWLEESTNSNYRIDILIRDTGLRTAIIIENKIYHELYNNLKDYWDHVIYPEENKIGVLLTLKPHPIPEDVKGKFINMTHSEWINQVKQTGIPFGTPNNYYQYITDFANTIENLSTSYAMNEQTKFYFQHAPKIIQAKQTMDEAYAFMDDQMKLLASRLGWETYGSAWDWRNIWDAKNHLDTYFTIWYGPLLEGKFTFSIIIELHREDKNRMHELLPLVSDHVQYKHHEMKHQTHKAGKMIHFCSREYSVTIEQMEKFGEYVYELILRDFADLFKLIVHHYYPAVSFQNWE